MPPTGAPLSALQDVTATCACLRVRMAARAVTRLYDQALRPVSLKITQFTVLVGGEPGRFPVQHRDG